MLDQPPRPVNSILVDANILTDALGYAARGFRIFYTAPGQKAPPPPNWPTIATTDELIIAGWFVEQRDRNIAWAPGRSGHLVLDVDVKKDGPASLAELEKKYGKLPATLTMRTPSGGRHYVLKGTAPTSANRVGRGLDIRSGVGEDSHGYALLPPSVVDGKPYVVEHDLPIAEAPEWLLALAQTKPVAKLAAPDDATLDSPAMIKRGVEHIERDIRTNGPVVVGNLTDNRCYQLACALRSDGLSDEKILELLREHWAADDFDDEWLAAKVTSADRNAQNERGATAISPVEGTGVAAMLSAEQPREKGAKDKRSRFRPMRRAEYANLPLPQWMIKDIMPATGIGLLIGHSGSFKTFVALGLAVAVATKRNTFGDGGYPVRQAGAAIVAAGEGGYAMLTQRVPAVEKDVGQGFTLDTYPFYALTALPQATSEYEVAEFITETKAATAGAPPVRLIILDTLNVMGGGLKENVAEDMGQLMRVAGQIRDAFDCFVLVLHHPPKDATGEDIDARGSGALRAGADCVYIAVRQRVEGKFLTKLIVRKMKDGEEDRAIYLEGKRIDLGINGDGDRVTSLVFYSIPKAAYESYAERTDELPRRIGRSLRDLEAYHPTEVATAVLAERLVGQGEQPASPEAHDKAVRSLVTRLSEAARDDQRVRAFTRRDGEHKTAPWLWSLPASSRPDEAP